MVQLLVFLPGGGMKKRTYSLQMYTSLMQGSTGLADVGGLDLTRAARGYRHSNVDIGGFQSASFSIGSETASRNTLCGMYDTLLGCRLVENTYTSGLYNPDTSYWSSLAAWEGIVAELVLTLDGIRHRRSLDPATWHNRVRVDYSSEIGDRKTLNWLSDASSRDSFGDCQFLYSLDERTVAAATAFQADRLRHHAWPVSRMVDSVTAGVEQPENSLEVTCMGYWVTANWQYYEANIAAANASTVISTLLAATQFLTAGGIEINAMQTGVQAERRPERIGNLLAAKAAEGDGINPWLIGCYGGRKVYYDTRPTTPTLFYRRGRLLDKAESPVLFPTVRAGQILHNASAPIGSMPPGSTSAENDPRNAYVQRVEFDADAGSLSLYFDNEDKPLTIYQPVEETKE